MWPCSRGCSQQVKHISCLVKLEVNPKCSCSSSWHCVHNVLVLAAKLVPSCCARLRNVAQSSQLLLP